MAFASAACHHFMEGMDMLPFSVLRTWGLGLFSWFIIGLGIFCLWKWNDLRRTQEEAAVQQRVEVDVKRPAEPRAEPRSFMPDKASLFLIAGLTMLGTTC